MKRTKLYKEMTLKHINDNVTINYMNPFPSKPKKYTQKGKRTRYNSLRAWLLKEVMHEENNLVIYFKSSNLT